MTPWVGTLCTRKNCSSVGFDKPCKRRKILSLEDQNSCGVHPWLAPQQGADEQAGILLNLSAAKRWTGSLKSSPPPQARRCRRAQNRSSCLHSSSAPGFIAFWSGVGKYIQSVQHGKRQHLGSLCVNLDYSAWVVYCYVTWDCIEIPTRKLINIVKYWSNVNINMKDENEERMENKLRDIKVTSKGQRFQKGSEYYKEHLYFLPLNPL